MKASLIILAFLFFSVCKGNCQYSIKVYEEGEEIERPSATLGQNDILLVCQVMPGYALQVSVDKNNWKSKSISYHSTFEISLEDDIPYFYVRLCSNEEQVNCIDYRLKPGRKYAISKDINSQKIKVIEGRN
jgi:hypothetical protein